MQVGTLATNTDPESARYDLCFQFLDQSAEIFQRQLSRFQLARQIMGKLENRIEERRLLRPRMQFAQSFGQRVERKGGQIGQGTLHMSFGA